MRTALLADIHGNIDALLALDAEWRRTGRRPDQIVVLGDLVDYGPAPAEVIDWVRTHAGIAVRGNHDHTMATGEDCRSAAAFKALSVATREYWRPRLDEADLDFLRSLPLQARWPDDRGPTLLVHATPRDPLFEYRRGDDGDAQWREALAPIDAAIRTIWLGHTHVPFVRAFDRLRIVNPGSLGMPKDGDPRGCYAIWEDGRIRLERIAYDVERTVGRTNELALPDDARRELASVFRTGGRLW